MFPAAVAPSAVRSAGPDRGGSGRLRAGTKALSVDSLRWSSTRRMPWSAQKSGAAATHDRPPRTPMILLCILILVVFWPDLIQARAYLQSLRGRRQMYREAREACENLDGEYERLMRSHR